MMRLVFAVFALLMLSAGAQAQRPGPRPARRLSPGPITPYVPAAAVTYTTAQLAQGLRIQSPGLTGRLARAATPTAGFLSTPQTLTPSAPSIDPPGVGWVNIAAYRSKAWSPGTIQIDDELGGYVVLTGEVPPGEYLVRFDYFNDSGMAGDIQLFAGVAPWQVTTCPFAEQAGEHSCSALVAATERPGPMEDLRVNFQLKGTRITLNRVTVTRLP